METVKSQELKRARRLIEACLDPLVTITTEGKITNMNKALASITGLTREQLTNTDFFDYFTEPQKTRKVYQEIFARGSVSNFPLTLRSKNGQLVHVLFNGSIDKDNDGNVLGAVITVRDITEQKRIETELTEAKIFAETATAIAEDVFKKIKYIDLDYLIHRTKSNPVLMMEMISLYLEQTPPLINAMKQGLQVKDWNLLYSAVHKMIPSFAIMGISPNFENIARKVQEYASTQQQSDEIPGMVLQLENICLQACIELKEEYNILKNRNL